MDGLKAQPARSLPPPHDLSLIHIQMCIRDRSRQESPKKKETASPVDKKPEPVSPSEIKVDERVPKNVRDLMTANGIDEWDIQNVVEARGYFPGDMPVWEYPKDFIDGCLVAAWDKVYGMIKEMKSKDSLVFN